MLIIFNGGEKEKRCEQKVSTSKIMTALCRCVVCFQIKMPIFQVEYFSLSKCDMISNACDVKKAEEEMLDKYQICQRQVDGCDLV